ncbi:MAG: metal-dependent transcriptional regulator [Ignavibacterium sp.]|uniref:metal-dependent transcriptional regulator n=1 Tax=Ignavibacterium sp. TaxID=2651167 RepID=UPI0040495B1C
MYWKLSESLEDYLFESYILNLNKNVIRLKDIAERKGVKPPSVVSAIKELSKRGFISQERYGYINLTKEGLEEAKRIYERHKTIFKFLYDILGVSESISEKDAHKMEHDLHRETLIKLQKFVELMEEYSKQENVDFLKTLKELTNRKEARMKKTLKDLKVGQSGTILEVKESGAGSLKERLLEMGAVPGTLVKVEKIATLGDPIDVLILGYHLSLRREEAEKIIVEEV